MFSGIGNINSYVKNMMMQNKINQKKQTGFSQEKKGIPGAMITINSRRNDPAVERIIGKMQRGAVLSSAELEYLRQNNTGLYNKALAIAKERDEFQSRLRSCKTQDDVRSMKAMNGVILSAGAAAGSAGSADPEFVQMRIAAINNEYNKFTGSKQYADMGKEELEKAKEKKDQKMPSKA